MTKRVFDHYRIQHDLTYTLAPATATPEPAPSTSAPYPLSKKVLLFISGLFLSSLFWTTLIAIVTYGGRL